MAFGSPLYGRSPSVSGGMANAEGIDMRLSDDVRPTPEVLLPPDFHVIESSLVDGDQYSFGVEESFLDWMRDIEDRERQRQEAIQEQQKQELERIQNSEPKRPDMKDESDAKSKTETYSKPSPDPEHSPRGAQLGMDILVPTPSDTKRRPIMVKLDSSNNLIDLADFENASDPFEAAELQTLNDMEELKNVLAISTSSPPVNLSPPLTKAPPINGALANGASIPGVSHPPSQVTRTPAPQSRVAQSTHNHASTTEPTRNSHIREIETFQHPPPGPVDVTDSGAVSFKKSRMDTGDDEEVKPPGHVASEPGTSQVDHDDLSQSLDNFILHTTERSVKGLGKNPPLPPIRTKESPVAAGSDQSPKEGARRRSQSSPMEISNHVESPPEYPKNLSKYTPLPPSRTGARSEIEQEDPVFSGLNEEGRNFAATIISMGFPKGRTARAVKRLGHDDRQEDPPGLDEESRNFAGPITFMGFPEGRSAGAVKMLRRDRQVIDALCAMDRLCHKGYGEERVEEVLNLLDVKDEEKIAQFLKLMKQFEELGFDSEDIKRELLLHGNEEEKVLDALTSKP